MAVEDPEQTVATSIALLRSDFQHISADVGEMKNDFKDFKRFYYTKEEAAYLRTELFTAHNVLANQMKNWKSFVLGVGVIVIAGIILAILKLTAPHL